MKIKAEYIWVDGSEPTRKLRSKTRIVSDPDDLPEWGFDGSSTGQAPGNSSDCALRPVRVVPDPIRGEPHLLVLCEVYDANGTVHPTNTRALLRDTAARFADQEPWFGIEQEYTMFRRGRPLGWPENGYPAPQGPFYCGVGADEVFGRKLVEEHLDACLSAGLLIYGINAEVMPGQWEFQIGTGDPLLVADHLLFARYLLYRLGEKHEISITLFPKPVRGDWNGAGAHTNFSTRAMREEGGLAVIHEAIGKLEKRHQLHIENYGHGIEQRLTGLHETCDYRQFKYGASNRGASVRIPLGVTAEGRGYFEDRRPNANVDPYVVTRLMLETCCA
ncbi:MAG: glutamine synthetase beta-grasp domain-containing protein [Alphaproteobacteria bacterium]|nr:glutamine synthetase beta-grasp domain-containing protein [Alphaproteobacteria bacterium]MCB9691450.1 glutamine synthetase beta-grasp domain-containing protein [Alphaproteobacteria bacterium]